MKDLSLDKIDRYLKIVAEINACHTIYDTHLHPVNVLAPSDAYVEDRSVKGLYRKTNATYRPPSIYEITRASISAEAIDLTRLRPAALILLAHSRYQHIGPKVLEDHLRLGHIDKGLLLPVAPPDGTLAGTMDFIVEMFAGHDRYALAGSVPNHIQNRDICDYLKVQIRRYGILAVKIHPGITGIDLHRSRGKERIEAMLAACARLALPVIIHTGLSYLPGQDRCEFAVISNFVSMRLDTAAPVVLAHGGAFGHSAREVEQDVLPLLKRILSKHPNVLIDVAGLSPAAMVLLISQITPQRILFGSDGLYENPFVMLIRLCSAIEHAKVSMEKSLISIVSQNAAESIFKQNRTNLNVAAKYRY